MSKSNTTAAIFYTAGGVLTLGGVGLLLFPPTRTVDTAGNVHASTPLVGVAGRF